MNQVKVKFADPQYDYITDVSQQATAASAEYYFVGVAFDMGIYPAENMQVCTGVEFIPGEKINS